MNKKSCSTCDALHYGPVPAAKGAQGYQCRRHPPQCMLLPKGVDLAGNVKMSVDAIWPVVNPKDVAVEWFCCDWLEARPGKFIGAPDSGMDN